MFRNSDSPTRTNVNKNATSMQRRLKTPMVLTYTWFHMAFLIISTGIFFVVNYALWIMLTLGGRETYLGVMSSFRVPNNYRPDAIRYIYYVDRNVVSDMLLPASVMLAAGIVMLAIRKAVYKTYVKREVFKEKEKNAF